MSLSPHTLHSPSRPRFTETREGSSSKPWTDLYIWRSTLEAFGIATTHGTSFSATTFCHSCGHTLRVWISARTFCHSGCGHTLRVWSRKSRFGSCSVIVTTNCQAVPANPVTVTATTMTTKDIETSVRVQGRVRN